MVAMSTRRQSTPTSGLPAEAVDDALQQVEHQMSLLLRRAHSMSHQLARKVHPDMEPVAYGLLTAIRREGPIRLTDLASVMGVGKPSISRQIAFLESVGLLYRESDPQDRRAQFIRLTEKGEEEMHQVQDARRQVLFERLGEWPLEELQMLAYHMGRLNAVYGEGFGFGTHGL
ncbi:MarR family transcriptional regulator [Arthrobacter sp. ISL-65]|uniref:MarR family winged helix-turn-helix transcriptional regulator n=1 Tax=Arthrobacter sp. ISL-65 TaxID=2819112 RepID=UPI001BE86A51|nr:MarR family transcriptional regulator [Arthrobacter sp. ISL-65]